MSIVSKMGTALAAVAAVAMVAHAADGRGRPVDMARLTGADGDVANWLTTGRTYDEQRFSPLDQIRPENVGRFGLAWYADLNMSRGEEATPLVIDGVLYLSTAWSTVRAFNASTGRPLWSFDPQVPRETLVKTCCDAVNRGVAAWNGRIYVGTIDGRLIALDQRTGKPVWSVTTVDRTMAYTITGAPRVVKGKVIIGNSGADLGVRGYVTAYDADSGRKLWRFYTVPGDPVKPDGEASDPAMIRARATWSGDAWWKERSGGGTVWDAFAYDPELDLLYIGTGNGAPWNRQMRSDGKGDNLYLSSIVAVRPDSGAYVWHYQTTPGDEWDYTATQHMILTDLTIAGQRRKVLMQAPKNGFFYVLDRATGKLISAEKYVPANWASHVDPVSGRPVENPAARYSENGVPWYGTPSGLGGHNWPPMSYSPRTGLVYIPAQEMALRYVPDPSYRKSVLGYNTGLILRSNEGPNQVPPIKETKGYLLAWDPVRQKEAWRAPRDTYGNGGVLSTGGGLVFQGTGTGFFKIMHAEDGRELWSMWAQTGVLAAPITYTVKGRQYVAVLAGCGGVYGAACRMVDKDGRRPNLDRVLVFTLDGKAKLPPAPPTQPMVLNPPPLTAAPDVLRTGRLKFMQYCSVCHGADAVSLGNQPDLRYSPLLGDNAWYDVVLDGALSASGMVGFSKVIGRPEAEQIRQYVISRAHEQARQKQPSDQSREPPSHSS